MGKWKKLQDGCFYVRLKAAFSAAHLAVQAGPLLEVGYLFVQREEHFLYFPDQSLYVQSVVL